MRLRASGLVKENDPALKCFVSPRAALRIPRNLGTARKQISAGGDFQRYVI